MDVGNSQVHRGQEESSEPYLKPSGEASEIPSPTNGGVEKKTPPSAGSGESGKFSNETTDMALFVRTSAETLSDWNRQRIVEALQRETTIDPDTAERISREVEETIIASKISLVTAPLVRELVDAKLVENGLEEVRKMHTRLGVPLYDVDQLILHPNRENANVPHGPEATNLTLAERIAPMGDIMTEVLRRTAEELFFKHKG